MIVNVSIQSTLGNPLRNLSASPRVCWEWKLPGVRAGISTYSCPKAARGDRGRSMGGKNTSDAAKGMTALSRKDSRDAAGRFTDGDALKGRDE